MTQKSDQTSETPESRVKAADTAPYMKKREQAAKPEPSSDDFFIPAVLLLVVGVIIVATFFEDEMAQFKAAVGLKPAQNEIAAVTVNHDYVNGAQARAGTQTDDRSATALSQSAPAAVESVRNGSETDAADTDSQQTAAYGEAVPAASAPALSHSVRAYATEYPPVISTVHPYDGMSRHPRQDIEDMRVRRLQEIEALRAAVTRRMLQDRREMFERMNEIQREIQRIRADALQRMQAYKHGAGLLI